VPHPLADTGVPAEAAKLLFESRLQRSAHGGGYVCQNVHTASNALRSLLRKWKLRIEQGQIPGSRNLTFVCRDARGRRVLVKSAPAKKDPGVPREHAVLSGIAPAPWLPKVRGYDAATSTLALEWIEKTRTLHAFHREERKFPPALARKLGATLARVHRAKPPPGIGPQSGGEMITQLLWTRPEDWAGLSPAGLAFFATAQAHDAAADGMMQLLARRPTALIHGDLRQPNVLVSTRGELALIDWERAETGDPARDVGTLAADYLMIYLLGALPEPDLGRFLRALLRGYGSLEPDFPSRVLQWAGESLLRSVYSVTHYQGRFDRSDAHLTQSALALLGDPAPWTQRWLA
jgi:aminoglycoside phosphotransferase (APT) family kinase protein